MPEEKNDFQNEDAEEELDDLEKQAEAEAAEAKSALTAAMKEAEADEVLKDLATDTPITDEKPTIQPGTFVDKKGGMTPRRLRRPGGRGFAG